jgi:hypothetical protein
MNRRRELGAFYTPTSIASRLTEIALAPLDGAPVVCDPACGDGAFLLAAADVLARRGIARETIVRELVWGMDIDADAVAAAQRSLHAWAGVPPPCDHVRVADGLDADDWRGRFDAVIGNPPFLNQLERATARADATRWPELGPYADTAFLFLLAGLDLVRPRGRVLLIQPQSIAAARDAGGVRSLVRSRAAIVGMWTCNERIFDAHVRVCAPLLECGAEQPADVTCWNGSDVRVAGAIATPSDGLWSTLLLRRDPPPAVDLDAARTLATVATATAGFRDQFYGLAPAVVEARRGERPKVVTCGVIDVGSCRWGEKPVRFGGRRWAHPRVDLAKIASPKLRRWVEDRLEPKVVLATQTRVLEAAVDEDGAWVPSTPVIAVHSRADDLFLVASVLLAPPVSAWAASAFAGTALSSDAIKLSARQVLSVPLPRDARSWRRGAGALRDGDLVACAAEMTAAYGCGTEVHDWWANRWMAA